MAESRPPCGTGGYFSCLRCAHAWRARKPFPYVPIACPRCASYRWNQPRRKAAPPPAPEEVNRAVREYLRGHSSPRNVTARQSASALGMSHRVVLSTPAWKVFANERKNRYQLFLDPEEQLRRQETAAQKSRQRQEKHNARKQRLNSSQQAALDNQRILHYRQQKNAANKRQAQGLPPLTDADTQRQAQATPVPTNQTFI